MVEIREFDEEIDYLQRIGELRGAGKNRADYKQMTTERLQKEGFDPAMMDLDYAFDQGNDVGKDIVPKIKKMEDGTVKEETLLDMNSKEGLAWAAASKELYDAMYKTGKKDYQTFTVNDMIYGPTEKSGPSTPEEFAQWGIEKIGWLNYNISGLGYDTYRLNKFHKHNPETAMAFNYLMQQYGKLPMFTWNGTKRFFKGVMSDPTTYAGLGTLGVGLAGRTFAQVAGKGALTKALNMAIHPNAITLYEGALFGAADDYLRQNIEINAEKMTEYDFKRMGIASGTGMAATGVLVGGANLTKNYAPYAVKAFRNMLVNKAENAQKRIDARAADTGVTLRSGPDFEDMADKGLVAAGKMVKGNRQLDRQGMYSKAQESLEAIPQEKGTGKQFVKQLADKFHVKPKELYWLGLNKFDNDKKVTKAELIQTIKDNYPVIKEHRFENVSRQADMDQSESVEFEHGVNLEVDTDPSAWQDQGIINYNIYRGDDPLERREMLETSDYYELMHKLGFNDEFYFQQLDTDDLDINSQLVLNENNSARLSEENVFDFNAARNALINGQIFYTDHRGRNIDISQDVSGFLDDTAQGYYMDSDVQTYVGNHRLGYSVYGNEDNGYTLQGPNGEHIDENIMTLDEVNVQATDHARQYGYISDIVPDDVDDAVNPSAGGDPSVKAGQARWAAYKLPGGTNYRELTFQIENFKGDPDQKLVADHFEEMIKEHQQAKTNLQNHMLLVEEYSSLPPSEQQYFLNSKNLKADELINKHNELYFEEDRLIKRIGKELEVYTGHRQLDSSVLKGDINRLTESLQHTGLSHHGQIDQVGHARIDDRVDPAGDKFMFGQEFQTDWGQKGRANMISPENLAKADKNVDLFEASNEAMKTLKDVGLMQKQRGILEESNELRQFTDNLFKNAAEEYRKTELPKLYPSGRPDVTITTGEQVLKGLEAVSGERFSGYFANNINDEMDMAPSKFFALVGEDSKFFDPSASYNDFLDEFHSGKYDEKQKEVISEYLNHYSQQFDSAIDDELYSLIRSVEEEDLLREWGISDGVIDEASKQILRDTISGNIPLPLKYQMMKDMFNHVYDDEYKNVMVGNRRALDIVKDYYEPENQKFIKGRKKEKYAVPRGPFVEKDQDFMEFTFKQLIRRAVDEGHKYIIVSGPEDQIARWGEHMRGPFERRYKDTSVRAAKEVLKVLDKKAKLELVNSEDLGFSTDRSKDTYDGNKTVTRDKKLLKIPITDEMRESVKRGMPLFEMGGLAMGGLAVAGSQMAQGENTETRY